MSQVTLKGPSHTSMGRRPGVAPCSDDDQEISANGALYCVVNQKLDLEQLFALPVLND